MVSSIAPLFGGIEPATVVIIAFALFLEYFKGRFVLGKTVKKAVARISSLPNPSSIAKV